MSNEFAFLSAQTPKDWERWAGRNIDIGEHGVTIAKTLELEPSPLGLSAVDFDLNPNGNLCVLNDDGIEIYVEESDEIKPLTLAGYSETELEHPALVATTGHGIYVVDDQRGDVFAFSRRRREFEWTANCATAPVAAVGSNTCVYLLDEGTEDGDGSVIRIESDGTTETVAHGLEAPIDISIAPDETLYVLDVCEDSSAVVRIDEDVGRFDEPRVVDLEVSEGFVPQLVAAQTQSDILVYGFVPGDQRDWMLVQYDVEAHTATELLGVDGEWDRLLSGTIGTAGDPLSFFLHSADSNEVLVIEEKRENKKDEESTRYEGTLLGRFDSGVRSMEWHRATLEIPDQPLGTRVDVSYYASEGETDGVDDLGALSGLSAEQQSELHGLGVDSLWDLIEYSTAELNRSIDSASGVEIQKWMQAAREVLQKEFVRRPDVTEVASPEDMLLTDADGRYLHVAINLIGSRETAPRLQTFRVYCPRQSYLRYLPEVYQERDRQSPFLSRFLSIFESIFVDIEQTLEMDTQYLDPQEIPVDYLSWLNSWVAVELGESWPEDARRELLERAPELYRMRGTKQGLVELIDLYFRHVTLPERPWDESLVQIERNLESLFQDGYLTSDESLETFVQYQDQAALDETAAVRILEYADLDRIVDSERKRVYMNQLGHPRRVEVLLHPEVPERHVHAVDAIVESESPVYTDVNTRRLKKRFQIEEHTYLGLNTILEDRQFGIDRSALGQQTIV